MRNLVIAIAFVCLAGCGGSSSSSDSTYTANIGDTTDTGKYLLTVYSALWADTVSTTCCGNVSPLTTGYVFIVIDVRFENTNAGEELTYFYSEFYDSTDRYYSPNSVYTSVMDGGIGTSGAVLGEARRGYIIVEGSTWRIWVDI